MIGIWIVAQVGATIAAVLAAGATRRRRAAAALLLVVAATLPWFAPVEFLLRVLLTLLPLVCLKTIQIAATPGPWPAWRRLWHLSVPFDRFVAFV